MSKIKFYIIASSVLAAVSLVLAIATYYAPTETYLEVWTLIMSIVFLALSVISFGALLLSIEEQIK